MKKRLLFMVLLSTAFFAAGQETLFQDDFESGTSDWTLNGGVGENIWVVNNAYAGLFPLINDTPNQPSGISGGPTSNYLHINNMMMGTFFQVLNANFDTGSGSNQNATMSANVSTVGKNAVTFSYWYLCAGAAGVSEGKVYYSVDNGSNWTLLATHTGVLSWTQATHTLPGWDNQATLKFRFNWTNGGSGADPAFSVDDVLITAESGSGAAITNVSLSNSDPWCEGTAKNIDVSFTSTGMFNAGNNFIAELSDATGSFAAAATIGTLASTTIGSVSIPSVIPGSVSWGSNYRIRVRSTDVAAISPDNGVDLVVNITPAVTFSPLDDVCVNHATFPLTGGTPIGGTYSGNGASGVSFSPSTAGVGSHLITYTYVTAQGCSNSATQLITVDACLGVKDVASSLISVYPNPVKDKLFIDGNGITSVTIYDLLGKEVISFGKVQSSYDLSSLYGGTYFVKVVAEAGEKTLKIQVR